MIINDTRDSNEIMFRNFHDTQPVKIVLSKEPYNWYEQTSTEYQDMMDLDLKGLALTISYAPRSFGFLIWRLSRKNNEFSD